MLEYGHDTAYGSRAESEEVQYHPATPTYAQTYAPPLTAVYNNHRLFLEGLKYGESYHFRLSGTSLEGSIVTSGDFTFQATPPEKPEAESLPGAVAVEAKGPVVETPAEPVPGPVPGVPVGVMPMYAAGPFARPMAPTMARPMAPTMPVMAAPRKRWYADTGNIAKMAAAAAAAFLLA